MHDARQFGARRAIDRHLVLAQQLRPDFRIEGSIVKEGARATTERTENDAGPRLRPTGIRCTPDHFAGAEIQPVNGRNAPRIDCTRGMNHRLGMAGRARGVIHDGGVFRFHGRRRDRIRSAFHFAMPIEPARGRSDRNPNRNCVFDGSELRGMFGAADRRLGFGIFNAIGDVARRQHLDARNRYCADAHRGDHRDEPFRQPRQHDDDAVALPDPARAQHIRKPAG